MSPVGPSLVTCSTTVLIQRLMDYRPAEAGDMDHAREAAQGKKGTPKGSLLLPLNDSSTKTRTRDLRINSPALYQSSYRRSVSTTYDDEQACCSPAGKCPTD